MRFDPPVTQLFIALSIGLPLLATSLAGGASAASGPVRFGMDIASIDEQAQRGVEPDLGMVWIGPWTLQHGWGGTDRQLSEARAAGVTPVIQFYYWGDDIAQDCIENGCYSSLHDAQKNKEDWQKLARQLVDHLHQEMGGEEVIIVLETEFNKNDVTTYEPLDRYLAEKADFFHEEYPASTVVLGLGNWGREQWGTWDRAAEASDWTGIQGLRGSTQDSEQAYLDAPDEMLRGAQALDRLFGKPVMLTDIGLSTYPEPDYLRHQETVLQEFFDRIDELKAAGVTAMMYRSFYDNPDFDTANYYGEAERHWGLARPGDDTTKPAFDVWKQGVLSERGTGTSDAGGGSDPPTAGAGSDASVEAEAFERRDVGGPESDARASEDIRWNLWANGSIEQTIGTEEAGVYALQVRATGHEADGAGPNMVASWDGQPVLDAEPAAGDYQVYASEIRVDEPGEHTLQLRFTNDRVSGADDRNLLLDRVVLSYQNGPTQDTSDDTEQGSTKALGDPVTVDGEDPTTVEAEAFGSRPVGGAESDPDASGGQRWNLWANGTISQRLDLPTAGRYQVQVQATGPAVDGTPPHLEVAWDGSVVLDADASPGGYATHTVEVTVDDPGERTLEVGFTNDRVTDGGDRNLFLDAVTLVPFADGSASSGQDETDPVAQDETDGSEGVSAAGGGGGGGGGGATASGGGGGGGGGGAPLTSTTSETDDGSTPATKNETEPASDGTAEEHEAGSSEPVEIGNETVTSVRSASLATGSLPRPLGILDLDGVETTPEPDAGSAEPIDLTATDDPSPEPGADADTSVGVWLLWAAISGTAVATRRFRSTQP